MVLQAATIPLVCAPTNPVGVSRLCGGCPLHQVFPTCTDSLLKDRSVREILRNAIIFLNANCLDWQPCNYPQS